MLCAYVSNSRFKACLAVAGFVAISVQNTKSHLMYFLCQFIQSVGYVMLCACVSNSQCKPCLAVAGFVAVSVHNTKSHLTYFKSHLVCSPRHIATDEGS